MTERDRTPSRAKPKPGRSAETEAREAERKRRLAEALRQNLRRRKAPGEDGAAGQDDG